MKFYFYCLAVVGAVISLGCGGAPKRIHPPKYSGSAGADAVSQYDKNEDGAISGEELESVPALKASLGSVDSNGDQKITGEEIDLRVETWRKSRIGQMAAICEVTLDGKPLKNATVTMEPEPFIGSNLLSGSGVTGDGGFASVSLPAEKLVNPQFGGMPCGWYKIRVTSSDEDIPARYNSETTLGCEVANYSHWQNHGAVKLELKSK